MSSLANLNFPSTMLCFMLFMFITHLSVSRRVIDKYHRRYKLARHNETFIRDMNYANRIVGGEEVDIKDFPHMVSIQNDFDHVCGGSLITFRWVLTASHCLESRLEKLNMYIVAGTSLYEYSKDRFSQKRRAVRYMMHPDYSPTPILNDIALIRVERDFYHSSKVSPVRLPTVRNPDLNPYEGRTVTVTGWGSTEEHGLKSLQLKKTDMLMVTSNYCQILFDLPQPDFMYYCAEEHGTDSCQGDSGGPLMLKEKQVGIVSYGYGCGGVHPGAYTRVDNYLDWIQTSINSHSHKINGEYVWILVWISFSFNLM